MNYLIRPIRTEEILILDDMLYESIYQVDPNNPYPREVIQIPEVRNYIANFGQKNGDYCLVAEIDQQIIGAVWVRILDGDIKGYGHVDSDTPEFAIALYPQYRKTGIGTALMLEMFKWLKTTGYAQCSLSVQKENYAAAWYHKLGFKTINENEEDYIMVKELGE